jgi:hypothetical protein
MQTTFCKVLISFFFFLSVWVVMMDTRVPILVKQVDIDDITTITDPDHAQAFYGELTNFPHTYEIRASEPFTLYTQILVPDIQEQKNIVSGIIIKVPIYEKRRVEEITRLHAKDAQWESSLVFFEGNSYRKGPFFEKELEAGLYRIEVHTPDNLEKYVLVVGEREEMTIGYFEHMYRLVQIKIFFEKSSIMVIQSPIVYVPFLTIVLCGSVFWYRFLRKRKGNNHTHHTENI